MQLGENQKRYKFQAVVLTALVYIIWLCVYLWCEGRDTVSSTEITAVSILGTVIVAAYVLVWWKIKGQLFNLMNVFLAFFVVFNFGQCLLWTVGIHTENEIGVKKVFHTLAADNLMILKAQLVFIICFVTFNCGALLMWNPKRCAHVEPLRNSENKQDERCCYLFYTALVLSVVVIPTSLGNAIYKLVMSQTYGYGELYNGEAAELVSNSVIEIITSLFAPCMFGLLIGSNYNKRVRLAVYGVFAVFAVVTLLGGDRGEWINIFVILFWAEYVFYKKRNWKTLAVALLACVIVLPVMNAIVSMRNTGISWEGFTNALTAKNSNPFVSLLIEFGQSMGISMLVIAYSITSPYGNTYLMSIPTAFSTGVYNRLFGADYVQIHSWFPDYLGISYGTDFSIIGEAILNYGVYAAPVVLLVEGVVIGRIIQIPYRRDKSPLELCLCLTAMVRIIKLPRSTLWLMLNGVIYAVVVVGVLYFAIRYLLRAGGKLDNLGYRERLNDLYGYLCGSKR